MPTFDVLPAEFSVDSFDFPTISPLGNLQVVNFDPSGILDLDLAYPFVRPLGGVETFQITL